jgi:hypothetical protein
MFDQTKRAHNLPCIPPDIKGVLDDQPKENFQSGELNLDFLIGNFFTLSCTYTFLSAEKDVACFYDGQDEGPPAV